MLAAYGGSQARGPIGAAAAGLHHSPSNARSELHLRPTPQLTATVDPQPPEQGTAPRQEPLETFEKRLNPHNSLHTYF